MALAAVVDAVLQWQQAHPRTYQLAYMSSEEISVAREAKSVFDELGIEAAAGVFGWRALESCGSSPSACTGTVHAVAACAVA